jgi:type IV fimbrial biogenesis protein FimT
LRGLTLVEMIVVLTIAAILVATGAPMYTQTIATYRLDAETNALLGDLQYARSEAIKQGTDVVICVSGTSSSGSPTCASNTNWAAGHLVALNAPGASGTSGLPASPTAIRQMGAFSGSDTAYANFVSGGTAGSGVGAIQFNRDGFAGTPSQTSWNGFSSLQNNVFIYVRPSPYPGAAGVAKCISISAVGLMQVLAVGAKDNANPSNTCT